MKFKKHSLYLIGNTTHICLACNEENALLVPLGFEKSLFYDQEGKHLDNQVDLNFELTPIEGLFFHPDFFKK